MAASSSSMPAVSLASKAGPGFHDKLNTQWHKRSLQLLMVVVLAHWAEHLTQAVQVFVLGWPRPQAGGVLGLWFPWMVSSEVLHYGYAVIMLAGIWVLRKGFTGFSRKWWTVALVIQFWHHIEHGLLQAQAILQHNLLGSPVPLSFLQMAFPKSRVEIHLFYNAIVFIPMVIGMYYHMFPPQGEHASCNCAWKPAPASA
ncbi:MAG: hypothetical protein ND895_13350 [Pyrinomonadaceae bacterium]|nr:hypothetical protein [Pyrinomonadaceae bacterium]